MPLTARHRQAAAALWECGGRVEDAAAKVGTRPSTLRRWLAKPEFRAHLAQASTEPLLQAASAMARWAPAAVAKLIQGLEHESPAQARLAARELLKLALLTRRELALSLEPAAPETLAADPLAEVHDPLSRRVVGLGADQFARVLAILNEEPPHKETQP
jgi:hypothetical protein